MKTHTAMTMMMIRWPCPLWQLLLPLQLLPSIASVQAYRRYCKYVAIKDGQSSQRGTGTSTRTCTDMAANGLDSRHKGTLNKTLVHLSASTSKKRKSKNNVDAPVADELMSHRPARSS
jgi:hypothetical protein